MNASAAARSNTVPGDVDSTASQRKRRKVPPPAPSGTRLRRRVARTDLNRTVTGIGPSESDSDAVRPQLPKPARKRRTISNQTHAQWLEDLPAVPLSALKTTAQIERPPPLRKPIARIETKQVPQLANESALRSQLPRRAEAPELAQHQAGSPPPLRQAKPKPVAIPGAPAIPRELDLEALLASTSDDDDVVMQLARQQRQRKRRGAVVAGVFVMVIAAALVMLSRPTIHEAARPILSNTHHKVSASAGTVLRHAEEVKKIEQQLVADAKAHAEKKAREAAAAKKKRRRWRR